MSTVASLEKFRIAAEIADSDAVLGVYAACEWDCLSDDGKLWVAEIVAETIRRFAPLMQTGKRCRGNLKAAPFGLTEQLVSRVLDATAPRVWIAPPSLAMSHEVTPEPFDLQPKGEGKGPAEPARVAPLLAARSVPVEVSDLDRPDYGLHYQRQHRAMMTRGCIALREAIEGTGHHA